MSAACLKVLMRASSPRLQANVPLFFVKGNEGTGASVHSIAQASVMGASAQHRHPARSAVSSQRPHRGRVSIARSAQVLRDPQHARTSVPWFDRHSRLSGIITCEISKSGPSLDQQSFTWVERPRDFSNCLLCYLWSLSGRVPVAI